MGLIFEENLLMLEKVFLSITKAFKKNFSWLKNLSDFPKAFTCQPFTQSDWNFVFLSLPFSSVVKSADDKETQDKNLKSKEKCSNFCVKFIFSCNFSVTLLRLATLRKKIFSQTCFFWVSFLLTKAFRVLLRIAHHKSNNS